VRKNWIVAALALASTAAFANPLELFGFTPRAAAMAGAQTALGDDIGASFYNPAGLIGRTKTELGAGFAMALPSLYVDRARPNSALTTAMPDTAARGELGVAIPVGGYFSGWVAIGGAVGLPTDKILRIENLDPGRPQFLLYQSKPQRFSASVDAAFRLWHGLSLGLGLQIAQSQNGLYKFGLDVGSRQVTARETRVDAVFVPVPVVGLAWDGGNYRLGFVWRGEQQQKTDVPTSFDIAQLGTLDIHTASSSFYWPNTFSLGASGRPALFGGKLLISGQLDLQLWSHAPSDEVQFQILPTGEVITNLGFSGLLGFSAPAKTAGLQSIVVPRIGFEYPALDMLLVRAGASLKPAITPEQSGSTSYLDGLTLTMAAGVGLKLPSPGAALPEPIYVNLSAGLSWLPERDMKKAGGDDPTGDASFGGSVWSFAAMVRYAY
jgi:hypothetical protein